MAVYLPTGAVGNGRVLATIGSAGEIMTFFYPHIDFAQNIHECLPCLYVGEPGHGVFHWTFGPEFSKHQEYLPLSNVLRTELRLSTPPLSLVFEYFDLRLGEVAGKQAVRYNALEGYVLQYFRDFVIAVGGSRPDIWRCGKAWGDQPQSAKQDLYDGHLNGQPEDIGDVNFALGWHMRLGTGQSRQIEIFMCADKSRERTSRNLPRLIKTGATALEEKTRQSDAAFVNRRRPVRVPPRFEQAYVRSLLALTNDAAATGTAGRATQRWLRWR